MIARPSFRTLRNLARIRDLWRRGARRLAEFLPKGLYKRSLLIVILPMVLLQTAVTFAFMQHHFELVTRRLSESVARDVAALADLYSRAPPGVDDTVLSQLAAERFRMDATLLPAGPLPPALPRSFFDALDPLSRTLPNELKTQLRRPFWVDTIGRSGLMEIRVDLGDQVLRLVTRRALAYEANAHIFILWMLGAMIALLSVAIIFLRNQIRPILRLARAAEDFGKGRDPDFTPHGAREVRQAGRAFIEMKRRIERATEQRTAMLNGVSHDLRTMLTRFKLSLALLDNSADSELLQKDVDEMGRMLEGYLAFARGDTAESAVRTDVGALLEDLRADAGRHGAEVSLETDGDLDIFVRPTAIRRCVGNLLANAERHADHVRISARRERQFVSVVVDDDGVGIPPEHREEVFRPFYRLDEARNQDEGGSGLGLAIARDIARSHGGDIMLTDSPMGGLRAAVRLPV
ncbi:two-component system osmolarity sensor histidine kinase EnvZ [Roseiarcus fermentans]|uniref:histidine kinase n=1 Tax=Roseiarcus fermentans TaxID=1473586 RepID=A0A366FPC1_9HYPH|nr:ATP-binding protein [Roseiarcus fermentans]RBP16411.1 two-component system osmolarity sensor histidine kinase EnvZ [Roseiarcus fermentans]